MYFNSRLSIFSDVCVLPAESGPCEAAIRRWFYNPRSRQCRRFTYGGCEGNGHNFGSRAACEARCSNEGELQARIKCGHSHHNHVQICSPLLLATTEFPIRVPLFQLCALSRRCKVRVAPSSTAGSSTPAPESASASSTAAAAAMPTTSRRDKTVRTAAAHEVTTAMAFCCNNYGFNYCVRMP